MLFRQIFWPLIFVSGYLWSAIPLVNSNFSDLLRSDTAYADDQDIGNVENDLWQQYLAAAQSDTARKTQHDRRELVYGDKVMKFSLEKRGSASAGGYPVYIALHGGGGAPAAVNDSQWQHMKIYYHESVDNGIYIAPRGITDTWNLHFRDESYPLYDRLIENLIAYEGADPNRVYLLGFSAGGDGVYQVVPRMPDRFAAANMSAGHHNWIAFDNLLNTPFLLQVGERDDAYNRNHVAAQNFVALDGLAARHQGYTHELFIHASAGHNGWYDNDASGNAHSIIRDPAAWLNSNDRSTISKDTNAVHWLKRFQRKNLPLHVIWDLSTRSLRTTTWGASYGQNEPSIKAARDLFYWLALNSAADSGRIDAEIKPEQNAIILKEVTGITDFRILLHRSLFDFSRPIAVFYQNQKIAEVDPSTKLNIMARTLLERGDRSLMFHDEIEVHLPPARTHVLESEKFSYCSNGHCGFMSAEEFKRVRNFPLDLNYQCKQPNHYALTFDDGPSHNLPAILEILARHQVPATFFVVGKNLKTDEGKALIASAHAAGHQIANHSFTHRSLIQLTANEVEQELIDTQNAIIDALGNSDAVRVGSSVLRPPFGDIDPNVQGVINNLGFTSVRWNSDRYDWKLSPEEGQVAKARIKQHLDFIQDTAKYQVYNHSIIDLNHEGSMATLSVLDEIIPMVKAAGFELVTVAECLGL